MNRLKQITIEQSIFDLEKAIETTKWFVIVISTWWFSLSQIMHLLALLQLLDTIGGLAVASQAKTKTKKISSRRFGEGWRQKGYLWLLILMTYALQSTFAEGFPVVIGNFTPSQMLAGYFCWREAISIVEKAIKLGIKVPSWLVSAMSDGQDKFSGEVKNEP